METLEKGQDFKTQICLSSAFSLDVYPNNRKSSFVNLLPKTIYNRENKRLRVRAKAVATSSYLRRSGATTENLVIWVKEVEEQRVNNTFNNTLTVFSWPPANKLGNNYGYQQLKNSAYLPTRFQNLKTIKVEILDIHGKEAKLGDGPPTLIWLELTNEDMEDQFTITCTSNHPELFPRNELNIFRTPLPSAITLPGYEVGLQNIMYPSNMSEESLAIMTISDEKHIFDLSQFTTTRAFFIEVQKSLTTKSDYKHLLKIFLIRKPGDENRSHGQNLRMVIMRDTVVGANLPPIIIGINRIFARACGGSVTEGNHVLHAGDVLYFDGRLDIYHARTNPLAMIHCSIIKPNIVGNKYENLLAWVPIRSNRILGPSMKLYEPEEIIYHPVKEQPFGDIHFKLTDTLGELRNFRLEDTSANILVSLIFRKIKKMDSYSARQTRLFF